ncbi:ArsA-related P-loop ATPase [Geodermatophilus sp. SYSU D00691]
MRTLLFTGPGGAGTSTTAAAAAVRAARGGARTLLVTRQAPPVAGLAAVAGLELAVVDAQAAAEQAWRTHAATLAALVPQVDLPPASSVVPPPGAAELAVLAALDRADADVVVLDAGPLEAGTALVALPTTLRWWLDVALPPRIRALAAIRTAAVRSGAARSGPVDAVLSAVPAVEQLLARVRPADPAATSVVLTATGRPAAVRALRAAATTLGLLGQRPAAVVARELPGGPGEWWAGRLAEQEAVLADLAAIAPLRRVPESAATPADVDGLGPLLDALELPDPAPLPAPAPERLDGTWRLVLPLPFAERDRVELTRWADDLVVTAAGVRRSVRLDALLRRCAVTGGRLADPGTAQARLEVTFAPDPRLWPADLLPAEESSP